MILTELVPLSSLTTLKVGGAATLVATCSSVDDIKAAIMLAHDRGLSWYVLGGGSNVLALDSGYDGVIIRLVTDDHQKDIVFEECEDGTLVSAHAGVSWDHLVRVCADKGLWGIENLAGIPGTVGAAPVQNIGAYGAEAADTLAWVEVVDAESLTVYRLRKDECAFGYRDSLFKHNRSLIITTVSVLLKKDGEPNVSYADIATRIQEGSVVRSPQEVGELIRSIRSKKFPDMNTHGTAGSFFKNPVISDAAYRELQKTYPELPGYVSPQGVKVSLAWILDKALHLKGYSHGMARLYDAQPLVLVTEAGATAQDVSALADDVIQKVFEATGITIEREVQSL